MSFMQIVLFSWFVTYWVFDDKKQQENRRRLYKAIRRLWRMYQRHREAKRMNIQYWNMR